MIHEKVSIFLSVTVWFTKKEIVLILLHQMSAVQQ